MSGDVGLTEAEHIEAIRERWSNGPTGRYGTETERRDQSDVEFLLRVAERVREAEQRAWDEGYRSGISDEAKSQDWTGGQVPPARLNPYRADRLAGDQ